MADNQKRLIEIASWYDQSILYSCEAESLREALERAVKDRANLYRANLYGANLYRANLDRANLYGANLDRANLYGARFNWQSHALIAEALRQAAGENIAKRKVAGLILISTDWCWNQFLAIDDPLREWTIDTLARCVRDGDNAPSILAERAKALGVDTAFKEYEKPTEAVAGAKS